MVNAYQPVIVGYDAISPLGLDWDRQWQRALRGESGVGPLTRFDLDADFPVRIAGQAPALDDVSAFPFLSARAMANWRSPIFKYGLLVVHRALQASGIEISADIAPRTAITFSSAIGGLDAVLAADRRMRDEKRLPHPFTNPNACINMVGGKVSILTGATGPIVSTITACATGLTSMIIGAMLLASDQADVAICGAVDFPLVEPIVAGFATMNGAFQHKPQRPRVEPTQASRPFSINRRGFVLAEGAAAVILTTQAFAQAHGLDRSLEMAGWAMTADAGHFVAPKLDTVQRCMTQSMAAAQIDPSQIDAVNAHATATKSGDLTEARALKAVFGQTGVPPVTANKSLIGHAMGASSAIETIFALEGMRCGQLTPTLNYRPDPECGLNSLVTHPYALPQTYVLKNAFGFGGCNACAVLHRRY